MRRMLPLLIVLAGLCVGCQNVKTPVIAFTDDGDYLGYKGGKGLVAADESPIPDVPMPIGFKPVISKSSSSFDGVVRTVNHVYQGRARHADAVAFYRGILPIHGWQFISRSDQTDGSTIQYFSKGRESLEVFTQQGTLVKNLDSSVTTIVITIGPRA